jgi:hypothetical protein
LFKLSYKKKLYAPEAEVDILTGGWLQMGPPRIGGILYLG